MFLLFLHWHDQSLAVQLDVCERLNFEFLRNDNNSNSKERCTHKNVVKSIRFPHQLKITTLYSIFETLCSINVYWCATSSYFSLSIAAFVSISTALLWMRLCVCVCLWHRHHFCHCHRHIHYVKCIKLLDSCLYSLLCISLSKMALTVHSHMWNVHWVQLKSSNRMGYAQCT